MANGAYIFDADENCPATIFRKYIGYLFTNGVFEDALVVTSGGGMSVSVSAGYLHINGAVTQFAASQTLEILIADGGKDRIDAIVAECDENLRQITIKAVTGGLNAGVPIAPDVVRTDGIYQLMIAKISVAHGTTEITASDIIDTRGDGNLCGFVTGRTKEIDFSQITKMFESQLAQNLDSEIAKFDAWYENDYLINANIPQEELDAAEAKVAEAQAFEKQVTDNDIPNMTASVENISDTAQGLVENKNSSQSMFFDIASGEQISIFDGEYAKIDMLIISGVIKNGLSPSFARRGSSSGYDYGTDYTIYALRNYDSSGNSTDVFRAWGCVEGMTYEPYSSGNGASGQYDFLVSHMMITFAKSEQTKKWGVSNVKFRGRLNTQKYSGTTGSNSATNSTSSTPWGDNTMLTYDSIEAFNASGGPFGISSVEAIIAE